MAMALHQQQQRQIPLENMEEGYKRRAVQRKRHREEEDENRRRRRRRRLHGIRE